MKRVVLTAVFAAAWGLFSYGQENVTSPAATEFVRYERIPVSYFNGLPSIDIPLYTIDYKDLTLPIGLSYHASGIKVNQYPTAVGLGWTLTAGGGITRVVNGIPDETCAQDIADAYSRLPGRNPGYYYISSFLTDSLWYDKDNLTFIYNHGYIDTEPDEFVINACGVSGSIYFYRDIDGKVHSAVKSNNGESFKVEIPEIIDNPDRITFCGGASGQDLQAYRIYKLPYEFTVTKSDGTKLIFGGDSDCIEFYTEARHNPIDDVRYMKTWPSAWMLREIISPKGNRIKFSYQRNGSPLIMSDVITDIAVYTKEGIPGMMPSGDSDRGKSFVVQHPLYPLSIEVDGGLNILFSITKSNTLRTVNEEDERFLKLKVFSQAIKGNILGDVCYRKEDNSTYRISYEPHNYFEVLSGMQIFNDSEPLKSVGFAYAGSPDERQKLTRMAIRGGNGIMEQKYEFRYNERKLPPYNSTVTDNWGYWNNKNYRDTDIDGDFFGFRSASLEHTLAETLTDIIYPTGGHVSFEYELNDYSKIATQVPDFDLVSQSGTAGGLRIRKIRYDTDTTSYIHRFKYEGEDGKSSGILSGIPIYVATGNNHSHVKYGDWFGLMYMWIDDDINQNYIMQSETYINMLGLTTGNHVTYSRVKEFVGETEPLVKEYRYTNHDTCPDTADFAMYTNIDNVTLTNKFTSRALERGLLTDEIWYNASGLKTKGIKYKYNSHPERMENYVRSIENFYINGIPEYTIEYPFIRYAPYKILTYYPYLESKEETIFDPSGMTVISSIKEEYTYNKNLHIRSMTMKDSKGQRKTMVHTYPDDYDGDVFREMQHRGMTSLPVETILYKEGKATEGSLTEYMESNSQIIPYKLWRLEFTEPADSAEFIRYDPEKNLKDCRYSLDTEILDSDMWGNPLLSLDASGIMTSYRWGYSASCPTAIVTNAGNTYETTEIKTPVQKSRYLYFNPDKPDTDVIISTFNSYTAGDVKINLPGALGFDWYVRGTFDGKPFNVVQMRSGRPMEEPWNRYNAAYGSSVVFTNVPAGLHTLEVNETKVRRGNYSGDEDGSLVCTYEGYDSHTEVSGHDELFYESFESQGGTLVYPFGYNSGKSFVGKYSVSLRGMSDKNYILDYRVYRNGNWQYVRVPMQSREYAIDEGINPIDEIRVRPEDAAIETYTWYPFIGLRSRTNGGGETESYGYDVFGRLQTVADNTGNIVMQYDYNYAGNSAQIYSPLYRNTELSMSFSSRLCDENKGQIPNPITYTVPSNKYSSKISEEDANRIAFDDIIANGQAYADRCGTCNPHIIVTIYNPLPEPLHIEYSWGVQGSIQYRTYEIAAGERTGDTGDVTVDFKPTIMLVPRYNYRSAVVRDSQGNQIPYITESGYNSDFFYAPGYYDDYKDTYIIREN